MNVHLPSMQRLSRQMPRGPSARIGLGDQVADGKGLTGIVVAHCGAYVGFRPLSTPEPITVRPITHVRRIA